MSTEEAAKEEPTISVKLRTNVLTNTVIKDANMLIVAMPLNTPKFVALGFLWSVLSEMTTFYEACERAASKPKNGLIKGTMADAVALGKSLLKS